MLAPIYHLTNVLAPIYHLTNVLYQAGMSLLLDFFFLYLKYPLQAFRKHPDETHLAID